MQPCMVLLFLSCEKEVLTPLFRDVTRILKEFLFMCGYMSVYTCTRAHTRACGGQKLCLFSLSPETLVLRQGLSQNLKLRDSAGLAGQ